MKFDFKNYKLHFFMINLVIYSKILSHRKPFFNCNTVVYGMSDISGIGTSDHVKRNQLNHNCCVGLHQDSENVTQ